MRKLGLMSQAHTTSMSRPIRRDSEKFMQLQRKTTAAFKPLELQHRVEEPTP
jgi:hypothetical protein